MIHFCCELLGYNPVFKGILLVTFLFFDPPITCFFSPDVPSPPIGPLSITDVTEDSCELTWKPPETDGGTPLTKYIVEMRETRRSAWGRVAEVKPSATRCSVPNLIVDNEYVFRVTAINAEGESEPLVSTDVAAPKKKLGKCSVEVKDLMVWSLQRNNRL